MPPCAHCGHEISPRALACPGCGEPGPGVRPPAVGSVLAAVNSTDGYAIASLACSASAFFGTFIIGSILGIVFGRMARGRLAANPGLGGDGLARAGVILGWVGVGLAVAMLVVGAAFLTAFASSSSSRVVRVGL